MPGPKTNERDGTRAVLRHSRVSAYKVRPVLDLIRGKEVAIARDILQFSERDAAIVVGKLLDSAIANADHNDSLTDPDELFVSACYADEGTTIKRWRPRARGRATRIRKRTCHVTVIVSRLPADRLARVKARQEAEQGNRRARRVAGGQGRRQRRDEQVPGTAEAPITELAAEVTTPIEADVVEQEVVEADVVEADVVEADVAEAVAPDDVVEADVTETVETEKEEGQ
jgi:large subunit ribosomal protein L22